MTTNSVLGVRVAQRLREQSPGLDVGDSSRSSVGIPG